MSITKKRVLHTAVIAILAFSLIFSVFAETEPETTVSDVLRPDTTSVELSSSRHTQPESGAKAENRLSDLSGYEKKMENKIIEVWFREEMAAIRVVDKRSGYVWGALGSDTAGELNEKWCAMANSLCTVEYYDADGTDYRVSLSDDSLKSSYEWETERMLCSTVLSATGLAFSFEMTMTSDGLEFAVIDGSIYDGESTMIKSLYFIPFFGCTNQNEIDGYMFVPDGPGALIRFSEAAQYMAQFEKKIYGSDTGIDSSEEVNDLLADRANDFAVDVPQISYPVYGVVHGANQNAVMSEVTSGDEHAVISAYPAGFVTDYNWITARFDYRQKYVHPTGQNDQGIETPQTDANAMLPGLKVTFLTGDDADYAGMARTYKAQLLERGELGAERSDSELPLQISIIGSEVKKGFLNMSLTELTTAAQAEEILDSVNQLGIKNISVIYSGWQKGGINGARYGTLKFEKQLGIAEDFDGLRQRVTDGGGRFYLEVNPVVVNEDQINPKWNAATSIGKNLQMLVRPNEKVLYNEKYLIQPLLAYGYMHSLWKNQQFDLCADELGSRLYSDYTRGKTMSRTKTMQMIKKLAEDSPVKTAYNSPNQYLWKNTAEYFDIPMVNSQYMYETDTVPFLQMLLKGSVDYYAPYANQGFYTQNSILKMIEYGAYPSFILMAADNYSLHNTPLEDYFSLQYGAWESTIESVYRQISGALEAVEGKSMINHEALENGVVRVTYSGGTKILINYSEQAAETADGMVAGNSYLVKQD